MRMEGNGSSEPREEGEGEDEHVEETVVPSSHAVPHPGTVMVKALCEGGRGGNRQRITLTTFQKGAVQLFVPAFQ